LRSSLSLSGTYAAFAMPYQEHAALSARRKRLAKRADIQPIRRNDGVRAIAGAQRDGHTVYDDLACAIAASVPHEDERAVSAYGYGASKVNARTAREMPIVNPCILLAAIYMDATLTRGAHYEGMARVVKCKIIDTSCVVDWNAGLCGSLIEARL